MKDALEWLSWNPDINPACTIIIRKIAIGTWKESDLIYLSYVPENVWEKYDLFSAIQGAVYTKEVYPYSLSFLRELCEKQFPVLFKSFLSEE